MTNVAYEVGFASVGQHVTVYDRARIVDPERIQIGNHVIIDDLVFLYAGDGGIRLGDFNHIGCLTSVTGGGGFVMEDFAGLSGGVRVYTADEQYQGGSLTNPTVPARYRTVRRAPVTIGRHAIIGANAVILPGVTIGEGAAVGSLALVYHDIEPWTICVGCPAKPIGQRPRDRILALEGQLRREMHEAR